VRGVAERRARARAQPHDPRCGGEGRRGSNSVQTPGRRGWPPRCAARGRGLRRWRDQRKRAVCAAAGPPAAGFPAARPVQQGERESGGSARQDRLPPLPEIGEYSAEFSREYAP